MNRADRGSGWFAALPARHPHGPFQGVRVTPNVHTTLDEVALFVDAMKQALTKGV